MQKGGALKGMCKGNLKDSLKGTGINRGNRKGILAGGLSLCSKAKAADICGVLSGPGLVPGALDPLLLILYSW